MHIHIRIHIYIYICICIYIYIYIYIHSRKLEHGLRMLRAGIPFSIPVGVWGFWMFQLLGVYCVCIYIYISIYIYIYIYIYRVKTVVAKGSQLRPKAGLH